MKKTKLDLITPGTILWEEFMFPLGITQNQLARDLDITIGRIHDIIHGRRAITADTALRLSKYFGTTPEFWINLQTDFDLRKMKRSIWPTIESRIHPHSFHSLKKNSQRVLKTMGKTRKQLSSTKTNKVLKKQSSS